MALEGTRAREGPLFVGAVLSVACASGCLAAFDEDLDIPHPSIGVTEVELQAAIWRWRSSLPPKDREVIDKEIMWREDLLIHVFLGHIPKEESRGGKSAVAMKAREDGWCTRHPEAKDIPWRRNWDSMYDPQAAAHWEERWKIPQPLEVALHHEFFGHILPVLRDPSLLGRVRNSRKAYLDSEREALAIENNYRRHLGFPEVPENLIFPQWFLSQEGLGESSTP